MEPAKPSHSVAINPYPDKGELTVLFGGSAQTEPLHRAGPQVLDSYLIHHIEKGRGTFTCRGTTYSLGKGQSFLILPGELVFYESDGNDPWAYRWVGFRGGRADELLSRMGLSAGSPVMTASDARRLTVQYARLQRALAREDEAGDLEAGGLLRGILSHYWRASPQTAPGRTAQPAIRRQIDQAIRWMNLQYTQPISIEEMAVSLGYHRTHLSKMFKEYTGQSPSQFLLNLRMDRARRLLGEPLSIEQIASSVGFPDPLYFSKQFKKRYGCSPTAYREQQDREDPYCR